MLLLYTWRVPFYTQNGPSFRNQGMQFFIREWLFARVCWVLRVADGFASDLYLLEILNLGIDNLVLTLTVPVCRLKNDQRQRNRWNRYYRLPNSPNLTPMPSSNWATGNTLQRLPESYKAGIISWWYLLDPLGVPTLIPWDYLRWLCVTLWQNTVAQCGNVPHKLAL